MAFKLGKEKRQIRNSKNTPIFRKNLKGGTLAEANMDGSIVILNGQRYIGTVTLNQHHMVV